MHKNPTIMDKKSSRGYTVKLNDTFVCAGRKEIFYEPYVHIRGNKTDNTWMKSGRMPENIQQTSDPDDNKISLITNFNGLENESKK